MRNRGAELRFDIIADQRQAAFFEALAPVGLRGDKDRNAIHESASCRQYLFDVPLCGHLGTDRQVGDHHVGAAGAQGLDDVVGDAWCLVNFSFEIFSQPIMGHAAANFDAGRGNIRETARVVGRSEDSLGQIFIDLIGIDIEGGAELNIAHMITAEVHVHEPWNEFFLVGIPVIFDPLNQRRSAIADADESDANCFSIHVNEAFRRRRRPAAAFRVIVGKSYSLGGCRIEAHDDLRRGRAHAGR